uniref:Glutathione-S-transferase 7 n=1 Tax=Arabidopsis lyrata subsp. lyrata TaxID=81972 RepID=B2BXJ7_ARALL|nr:glutathione-S-transferase 7 [Arabidopsis lyrata subsp. lyrata]
MAERRADLNLPMRLQCNTCDHIMSNGTQFNSRVEQVIGETYLGIKILRFHIQCTNCTAEIKFKTDPKNVVKRCKMHTYGGVLTPRVSSEDGKAAELARVGTAATELVSIGKRLGGDLAKSRRDPVTIASVVEMEDLV